MHVHIEAVTMTGVRHVAELTLNDPTANTLLLRKRDESGSRWFPPDTNHLTKSSAELLISDDSSEDAGHVSRAQAEVWVREGLSFVLGPCLITDPDVQRVLTLSRTELAALIPANSHYALRGALLLMQTWEEDPDVLTTRLIAW